MFLNLIFLTIFVLLIELYFSTKAIFFILTSLILVIVFSLIALFYSLDLLFLTIVLILIGITLSLILLNYSLIIKPLERVEFISYLYLFFFIMIVPICQFLNSSRIEYCWIDLNYLNNVNNYQMTFIIHYLTISCFFIESYFINIMLFLGLCCSLSIINFCLSFFTKKHFTKININLKLKRLSRRQNSFSSFFRK